MTRTDPVWRPSDLTAAWSRYSSAPGSQRRRAELVEHLGHDLGVALKNQGGPPEVLSALADLADELTPARSRAHADQRDRYEVLLVGSESLESVKATHGRFFPADTTDNPAVLAQT